jgi:hypothetical protein
MLTVGNGRQLLLMSGPPGAGTLIPLSHDPGVPPFIAPITALVGITFEPEVSALVEEKKASTASSDRVVAKFQFTVIVMRLDATPDGPKEMLAGEADTVTDSLLVAESDTVAVLLLST